MAVTLHIGTKMLVRLQKSCNEYDFNKSYQRRKQRESPLPI